jgi:hypothetical protein
MMLHKLVNFLCFCLVRGDLNEAEIFKFPIMYVSKYVCSIETLLSKK